MALFGWIVVVFIAAICSFATLFGGYFQLALTNTIDKSILIPLALCIGLWYVVVDSCPLTLTIN